MRDFNWNDLRFFLALARAGTAAAAARQLRVDHNTIRRRVAALEEDLSTLLFDSRDEGYALTEAGEQLLILAEGIEGSVAQAHSAISGQDMAISGTVRLGVPDGLGTLFIAPRLAKLRALHPALGIELIVTSGGFNLSKREADMAIFIDRPKHGRMQIKKISDVTMRLYASKAYLSKAPPIRQIEDLSDQDFVSGMDGLDFGASLNDRFELSAAIAPRVKCTSSVAVLKAAAGGAGLCLLSRFIAETEAALVPVLPDEVSIEREIWLAFHSDLKELGRIRVIADFLIREFTEARSVFA